MSDETLEEPQTEQPEPKAPALPQTQEQFNKIVETRLARQKEQLTKQFSDYEDLKKKAEEFDKLAESNKSEFQRLQEDAAKYQKQADQFFAELKAERIRTAIITAASQANALDPDVVYAALQTKIEVGDDGQPLNVQETVQQFLEQKPFLVGQVRKPAGNPDGGPRKQSGEGQLTAADLQRLKREGKFEEIAEADAKGLFDELKGRTS